MQQVKGRKLKVYNQSRGIYYNIPTILLKGHGLKEFNFNDLMSSDKWMLTKLNKTIKNVEIYYPNIILNDLNFHILILY